MSPSGSAPVILIVGRLAREAKGVRGAPFAAGQRYFQAVARGGDQWTTKGMPYSDYENAAGTGQVHMWFPGAS